MNDTQLSRNGWLGGCAHSTLAARICFACFAWHSSVISTWFLRKSDLLNPFDTCARSGSSSKTRAQKTQKSRTVPSDVDNLPYDAVLGMKSCAMPCLAIPTKCIIYIYSHMSFINSYNSYNSYRRHEWVLWKQAINSEVGQKSKHLFEVPIMVHPTLQKLPSVFHLLYYIPYGMFLNSPYHCWCHCWRKKRPTWQLRVARKLRSSFQVAAMAQQSCKSRKKMQPTLSRHRPDP